MDLTCILLTWNSAAYVDKCLQSVFADLEASGLSHEVIVIDNGSVDTTLSELARFARPTLSVIALGHNTGTTFSRNIGLRMARGRYIAILDSDIEIRQAGIFASLFAYLGQHRDTGIVAPRLQFPSGRHQMTVDRYPTLAHKFRRLLSLRAMEQDEASREDRLVMRDVDYAVSAFWMMPAQAVREVGLLDERIFYAPEDVDYCLRVALQGYRITYLPSVVATHHAQEISRRRFLSRSFREHLKGLAYFWKKHQCMLSPQGLYRAIDHARLARKAHGCAP